MKYLQTNLLLFTSLKELYLPDSNQFTDPPPHVIGRGLSSIQSYLKAIEEGGTTIWNKMKIILIGNGGVGKSSIIKVINHINQSDENKSNDYSSIISKRIITEGGDIINWKRNRSDIDLQVWDFAGQEEYTTTHRFFFSNSNSIYLIAFDPNLSNPYQNQILFWLNYIEKHTQQQSTSIKKKKRIVFIATKMDELNDISIVENIFKLLIEKTKEYNIIPTFITSSSKKGIIQEWNSISLLRKSEQRIDNLHYILNDIAKSMLKGDYKPTLYVRISNWCQSISKQNNESNQFHLNFISLNEISSIIMNGYHGMENKMLFNCLRFLHDVGDVVLTDLYLFIDPQLMMKLIQLFVHPLEGQSLFKINEGKQGILTKQEIIESIENTKYKSMIFKINELIDMFEYLEICFNEKEKDQYLFPLLRKTNIQYYQNEIILSNNKEGEEKYNDIGCIWIFDDIIPISEFSIFQIRVFNIYENCLFSHLSINVKKQKMN